MVLLDGIGSYRFLAGKCESIVLVSKESVKAEFWEFWVPAGFNELDKNFL
jgi:hypothetical protein